MRHTASAVVLALVALTGITPSTAARAPTISTPTRISGPSPFAADCSGLEGHFHGTEVEPHVTINPADPKNIVAAWQQDRFTFGGSQGSVVATTTDRGRTWRKVVPQGVSQCANGTRGRATDPWLTTSPGGTMYLASLSYEEALPPGVVQGNNALVVSRSADGGLTWTEPFTAVEDAGVIFNDKEALTADPTRPGVLYLVWARFIGLVPVSFLTISLDHGETWLPPVPIVNTGTVNQGNEIVVLPDGTLLDSFQNGSVRVVRSDDGGFSWSPVPTFVGGMTGAQPVSPEGTPIRAASPIPDAAVGRDGSAYVAWQDVGGPAKGRIKIARTDDGGLTWTDPMPVGRSPKDAFLPGVAVAADGTVGVVYYDFRNDTPRDGRSDADVWFAWSTDRGRSWAERHLAGPFDFERAPVSLGRGLFLGDYIGVEAHGTRFHAIFSMTPDKGRAPISDIYHASITF